MSNDKEPLASPMQPVDCGNYTEAAIDEALEESFPASDPPPWTLGTTTCADTADNQEDASKTSNK